MSIRSQSTIILSFTFIFSIYSLHINSYNHNQQTFHWLSGMPLTQYHAQTSSFTLYDNALTSILNATTVNPPKVSDSYQLPLANLTTNACSALTP